MTCKDFESLVTEYLEEALSPAKRADFEAHLAACTDCRGYLDQMRVLITASHGLGDKLNEEWRTRVPDTQEQYFEKLQVRASDKSRAARVRYRKLVPTVAAAIALAIAASVWFGVRPAMRSVPSAPQNITIDISHWMRLRGAEQPSPPPVKLKRARLNLTILLPVGTEAGKYQVALRRDSKTLVRAQGEAKIENYTTALRVQMDCKSLRKGAYTLSIRRDDLDWVEYPAVLR